MDPAEAALRVLREDPGRELHWTVIWDRALQRGYVNPMEQPDARDGFLAALAAAARAGTILRPSKGTYAFPDSGESPGADVGDAPEPV